MSWVNSKKDSNSIWVKNKEKQSRQLETLFFTMLKNLDFFLYWSSLLFDYGAAACQLQQNVCDNKLQYKTSLCHNQEAQC